MAVLGLILLGFGCNKAPATHNTQVVMEDSRFVPDSVEVAVGDTVTWVNQGALPHTSTSGQPGAPDGRWDSGTLANGGSFMFVFTSAGDFHYYCTFHGAMGMKGVVSVK
jgi:plastocyanin